LKKWLLMASFFLVGVMSFSMSLGIKGQFITTGMRDFEKGIRITSVYENTIAERFLKPGDILLGMTGSQVLGWSYDDSTGKTTSDTGQAFSAGFKVYSKYINRLDDSECMSFSSVSEFQEFLSMFNEDEGGIILQVLIYRNNRFIEFTLQ